MSKRAKLEGDTLLIRVKSEQICPDFTVSLPADNNPTVLDLRREVLRLAEMGDSFRFNLVFQGKLMLDCKQPLTNEHTVGHVALMIRMGGNPCSAALDTKNECRLFIFENERPKQWILGPRGHAEHCKCPDRFVYPTLVSRDQLMSFEWHVNQDCYSLSQDTFNADNIAVWCMDHAATPFAMKSVKLEMDYAISTYDKPDNDHLDDNICVVHIRPPQHGWNYGFYELRFNRPENINNNFHISGFGGQRVAHTRYPGALSLNFLISPGNYADYETSLATKINVLDINLIRLIVNFLFSTI